MSLNSRKVIYEKLFTMLNGGKIPQFNKPGAAWEREYPYPGRHALLFDGNKVIAKLLAEKYHVRVLERDTTLLTTFTDAFLLAQAKKVSVDDAFKRAVRSSRDKEIAWQMFKSVSEREVGCPILSTMAVERSLKTEAFDRRRSAFRHKLFGFMGFLDYIHEETAVKCEATTLEGLDAFVLQYLERIWGKAKIHPVVKAKPMRLLLEVYLLLGKENPESFAAFIGGEPLSGNSYGKKLFSRAAVGLGYTNQTLPEAFNIIEGKLEKMGYADASAQSFFKKAFSTKK